MRDELLWAAFGGGALESMRRKLVDFFLQQFAVYFVRPLDFFKYSRTVSVSVS